MLAMVICLWSGNWLGIWSWLAFLHFKVSHHVLFCHFCYFPVPKQRFVCINCWQQRSRPTYDKGIKFCFLLAGNSIWAVAECSWVEVGACSCSSLVVLLFFCFIWTSIIHKYLFSFAMCRGQMLLLWLSS